MKKFYVIANSEKDKDGSYSKKIRDYIKASGKVCLLEGEDPITEDVDCILVLGGDGTLLRAARNLVQYNIPFLGINLGTLGYLAEIDKNSILPALDRLFEDQYSLEPRMMMKGTLYHEGEAVYSDIALNDIVIMREGPLRVVRFNNYVNDEFLNAYQSDGVIIATATGSTGYSLSVGGPIVSPKTNMMMITPLAPHTLNSRSVIFPPDDKIKVEIGPGRYGVSDMACVNFDGNVSKQMVSGDYVEIQRAEQYTKLVKINHISFLEVLRTKLKD